MDLAARAYDEAFGDGVRPVIDDAPLLDWADGHGLAPWQAQLEALRQGIVPSRYFKNLGALSLDEQIRVCESRVFICGCGGLGGTLINLMARAGVGTLRLVDSDLFSPSNLNRQWLCDTNELARPKAVVARERARAINPLIQTEAEVTLLTDENADALVQGMDLALDAFDNVEGRFSLSAAARRAQIPFIHAAATGWWGQISTFLPGSGHGVEQVYGPRRALDASEAALGVLGPTPAIIASLQALEALRILTGKAPVYAGRLLYFDGESGRLEIIPL